MDYTQELIKENIEEGSSSWNSWINEISKEIPKIEMHSKVTLRNTHIPEINISIAEFPKVYLEKRTLEGFNFANLKWILECHNIVFVNCKFDYSYFNHSDFSNCNFKSCSFISTRLINCDFNHANFSDCKFIESNLSDSNHYKTIYNNSVISNSTFMWARLIGSTFKDSTIINTKIFGASIWDLQIDNTVFRDLIISKKKQAEIKIDNIEIAQFLYLLLNNQKLRDIITTLTSKIVLILGRFTDERIKILEGIKHDLTNMGFVPVLFTFEPSPNRDITETIQLLASLSKVVIADITEPKSIPQELSNIIPFMPSLRIQPIIIETEREYGMFEHWKNYNWVKPIFRYKNIEHITNNLSSLIEK